MVDARRATCRDASNRRRWLSSLRHRARATRPSLFAARVLTARTCSLGWCRSRRALRPSPPPSSRRAPTPLAPRPPRRSPSTRSIAVAPIAMSSTLDTSGTPGETAVADVSATGAFVRKDAVFRSRITANGPHPPEAGRYHLYVSLACPWASRCLAVMGMKGLEHAVSVTSVHPTWRKTRPDDRTTHTPVGRSRTRARSSPIPRASVRSPPTARARRSRRRASFRQGRVRRRRAHATDSIHRPHPVRQEAQHHRQQREF